MLPAGLVRRFEGYIRPIEVVAQVVLTCPVPPFALAVPDPSCDFFLITIRLGGLGEGVEMERERDIQALGGSPKIVHGEENHLSDDVRCIQR